jgi:UDP-N-acetylglucosamine enolpyruvyl transferase
MNFTVAGFRATGETILTDYESIEKTFKNFAEKLIEMGGNAKVTT